MEYAKVNQVEHIVIGAPPADVPLKGTFVSTRVAAEARCTVTVVRPPGLGRRAEAGQAGLRPGRPLAGLVDDLHDQQIAPRRRHTATR